MQGVSEPYKHTIRAFLVQFHMHILSHSTEHFSFKNGSVGERLARHRAMQHAAPLNTVTEGCAGHERACMRWLPAPAASSHAWQAA